MRSFIAIAIPEGIKQEIAKAQDQLRESGVQASWTKSQSIHLTLKFLGEVEEGRLPAIMAALDRAVQGTGRFMLEIAGSGAFPNPRNARVAWLGIAGEVDKLKALQAAVENEMERSGMERENRPFQPHLTLGRIKSIRSRDRWVEALERIRDIRLPGFEVDALHLMKSELRPAGARYTEIGKAHLE